MTSVDLNIDLSEMFAEVLSLFHDSLMLSFISLTLSFSSVIFFSLRDAHFFTLHNVLSTSCSCVVCLQNEIALTSVL